MTWTHGGVAAAIQLACLAFGVSLWAGAAVAVALYLGREQAQAEFAHRDLPVLQKTWAGIRGINWGDLTPASIVAVGIALVIEVGK